MCLLQFDRYQAQLEGAAYVQWMKTQLDQSNNRDTIALCIHVCVCGGGGGGVTKGSYLRLPSPRAEGLPSHHSVHFCPWYFR